jgi:predicted class III extradiol MEMO1 family dioxygenase
MANSPGYMVVMEPDRHILISKVNQYMKSGWRPLGGVAIDTSATGVNAPRFFQAMVQGK